EIDTSAALAAALGGGDTTSPAPSAPSGPPLTQGERDGLRIAVSACWNLGSLSTEAMRTRVTIAMEMNRDGTPLTNSIRLVGSTGGSQAAAAQAFEAGRRAIVRCGQGGFELPDEKFEQWREIEMTFDPEQMRSR
ncbi:MAG: energy transducer TonB, partial [Jannaschia sp.]